MQPGEDAFLEGEFGAQVVLGGQGALPNGHYPFGEYRKAIHEMKHFACYSMEQGRNERSDTADISLRDLSEYYFVPLRTSIVKADLGAFMCSCERTFAQCIFHPSGHIPRRWESIYHSHRTPLCTDSAINGTASCGNRWMNVDVVRRHWGWDGVIESDWYASSIC